MKVYAVVWAEIEAGGLTAIYSTRELAEKDWEMRNQDACGYHWIEEVELDLDPKANEPDIDRRPKLGPETYGQYVHRENVAKMTLDILKSRSPLYELVFHQGHRK